MFIKLSDQSYPHDFNDIAQTVYPASLPQDIGDADLASLGFARVQETARPTVKAYDGCAEAEPELVGGKWHQKWEVARAPLTQCKQIVLGQINATCENLLRQIKSGYPPSEVEGWSKQEVEARAYVANNSASVPLISSIAAARGVPVGNLAARIIAKADAYAAVYGEIVGIRQALEDDLDDADEETIDLVAWPE